MNNRAVIGKLAEDVRKELNLDNVRNVNMLDVLNNLGIVFEEGVYHGAEGAIRKEADTYVISLEREYDESNPRDKFTLAHELGHLFLHIDEASEGIVFTRKGTTQAEYDANEFAANFLMPKAVYMEVVEELKKDNRVNITELAKEFGVSNDAALMRGKFLGVFSW